MHREITVISSIFYSFTMLVFYINDVNLPLYFLFTLIFLFFLNKVIKYFNFTKRNVINLCIAITLHLYFYQNLLYFERIYSYDFNLILYTILIFYYFRYFIGKLFCDYKLKKDFLNGTKLLKNYDYKEYLYIKTRMDKMGVNIPIYVSDRTDSWAELTVDTQNEEVFVFNTSFFNLNKKMKEAIILHEIGHYKNKHIKKSMKLDYIIRLIIVPSILIGIFFILNILNIKHSLLIFTVITQFFFTIDVFILNRITFLKELEAEKYLFKHLKLSPMEFLLYVNISKKSIDIENNHRNRIIYSFIKGYPTKEHLSDTFKDYYTKEEQLTINSNLSMIRNFNKMKKKFAIQG